MTDAERLTEPETKLLADLGADAFEALMRDLLSVAHPRYDTCMWLDSNGRMCGEPVEGQREGLCPFHWHMTREGEGKATP